MFTKEFLKDVVFCVGDVVEFNSFFRVVSVDPLEKLEFFTMSDSLNWSVLGTVR